jgi:hypothetical protein
MRVSFAATISRSFVRMPRRSRVATCSTRSHLASALSSSTWRRMASPVLDLTYQGTKNLRIGFPPLREQQQIAAFLDWKTGQIDALILRIGWIPGTISN